MALPIVSANSPSAGYISWQAFSIQYQGESFAIPAGSTNNRWVWWRWNGGGTSSIIEAGPDVPGALSDDDLIILGNKLGVPLRIQSMNLLDGDLLIDGSVVASALSADAINGKVIVGAEIIGSEFKTASSGARLEMRHAPLPGGSTGAIEVFSGLPFEEWPGYIYANSQQISPEAHYAGINLMTPDLGEATGSYVGEPSPVAAIELGTWRSEFPGGIQRISGMSTYATEVNFAAGEQMMVTSKNTHISASERLTFDSPYLSVIGASPTLEVGSGEVGEQRARVTKASFELQSPNGQGAGWMSAADNAALTVGAAANRQLTLRGANNQNVVVQLNGTGLFAIQTIPTASSGTALLASPSGILYRSTSSRRYKRDIQPVPLEKYSILDVEVVNFRNKEEVERYEETGSSMLDEGFEGVEPRVNVGVIAEQLDEIGLSDVLIFDELGRPDAVQYDKLALLLIPVVKDQRERIESLESRLAALEQKVNQL